MSEILITNFIREVESRYLPNPYHTNTHATNVMHAVYYMITHSEIKNYMTDLELLGTMIACACIDMGHPGVTNSFLIHTKSPLAIRYGGDNILEQYHVSMVFKILNTPGCGLLDGMTSTQYQMVR